MNDIKVTKGILHCPKCDFEWGFHHEDVTVFSRAEDKDTVVIAVYPQGQQVATVNPSARRHGLVVGFWCESCGGKFELTIAQHKGSTEIEWHERETGGRKG